MCGCCASGDKPVWQAWSREWVHQLRRPNGASVVVCVDPPVAPDGGVVRARQGG